MYTYHFTKRQAETAARATIVNYSERYPNEWQDEEALAYDVSALLGIKPEPNYVAAALQALDDLRKVENGTHMDLDANDPADLIERFEGDLLTAVRDVISTFPFSGREVFIPTMELAA
ncbi:hypothetical protein ACTAQI_20155 [Pseudarthrobacter sp. alpha12b]